jgi:hypothetical protein
MLVDQFSIEAPESCTDGADRVADEVPSGVGVASNVGFGEAGGDELEDLVEGSESHTHDGGDDREGESGLGAKGGTDDFPARDGGAEESEGVDDLVVAGEIWSETEGVEDGGAFVWDELGADWDGASDHVEESPDGEEPECGSGEVDQFVEFDEDEDDDEEGAGVEEELGVALVESHDRGDGHEGEDEECERSWYGRRWVVGLWWLGWH